MEKEDERPQPERLPKLARFDVLRPLGGGAGGLVYEAIDRERGQRVALKTLHAMDGGALLQLKAEFRALQDIQHPNLVRLDELVRDGDTWFFTMELVEGTDFRTWVTGEDGRHATSSNRSDSEPRAPKSAATTGSETTGRLDEARLRAALAQLARGLLALHAAGKVHRDLKPENVLVSNEGRVVILDFGLVRDTTAAADETIVGTVPYIAPEQIAGEPPAPPCDWYAVGVMVYACLTGRLPFAGSMREILERKMTHDPPPPRAIAPDVPADLDALCIELLHRDPAARPTGSDVSRRLDVVRASIRPPAEATHRLFVGREEELAALARAFDESCSGRTVVAIVEGQSGVGKSAVVRQFRRALPARALVLSGRCYENESVPFKAVDGVIDDLSEELARVGEERVAALLPSDADVLARAFPVLGRLGTIGGAPPSGSEAQSAPRASRARLFAAMRALFWNLARRWQVVVVIDDLQWADGDSLALLRDVLRQPGAPPMLLVATARARDGVDEGPPFDLPGDVRVVPLAGLDGGHAVALARSLLERVGGADDPALARAIADEAAGHPLFLDALVRHVSAGGDARSLALDDALRARVDRLDPDARGLAELLAVAGVALDQATAMSAADLDGNAFASCVRALRVAHLARTTGARGADLIEPYHDRVREAVAARLTPERRRSCHAALARAIESSSQDAEALAAHWDAAGEASRAREWTARAAHQAYAALAFDRAASLYARALALTTSDAEKQTLRERLADALANTGRGVEAARAYEDASAGAATDRALDLRRCAAEQLLNAGRFDQGDAALRAVLAAVHLRRPRSPLTALIGLIVARAILRLRGMRFVERAPADVAVTDLTRLDACAGVAQLLGVVDTIRAAYFQTRTVLFALAAGEPSRLVHALCVEGALLAGVGPKSGARADRVFASADVLAARIGTPRVRGAVTAARAFAAFCQGRFPDALRAADGAAGALRDAPGAFWDFRMSQLVSVWSLSWSGRLGELARRVDLQLREADMRGDLYAATCLRAGPPSIAALRDDAPAEARAIVTRAMSEWTQRGYHNQHYWGLLAESQIDLYEGNGAAALARVRAHWPRMKRSLMLEVQIIRVEATHLRARAALATAIADPSSRARLLRVARRDAKALSRMGVAYATPLGALIAAAVANLEGDAGDAAAELARAIAGFDEAGMELHAAAARWQLGALVGGDFSADAEAWMAREGIKSAARTATMIAPGFASGSR